jgi:hypothetical protein
MFDHESTFPSISRRLPISFQRVRAHTYRTHIGPAFGTLGACLISLLFDIMACSSSSREPTNTTTMFQRIGHFRYHAPNRLYICRYPSSRRTAHFSEYKLKLERRDVSCWPG